MVQAVQLGIEVGGHLALALHVLHSLTEPDKLW